MVEAGTSQQQKKENLEPDKQVHRCTERRDTQI
jgi:hypothetical protein